MLATYQELASWSLSARVIKNANSVALLIYSSMVYQVSLDNHLQLQGFLMPEKALLIHI